MKVTTFQGIVENGQIPLPDTVRLPENATVYVVVPGVELSQASHIGSPRLVHPEQAADFKKEVVEEEEEWRRFGAQQLARAYGPDEPDYRLPGERGA